MENDLFETFLELHAGLPRQAPGSVASTLQALELLPLGGDASGSLTAADMGCGPGAHTLPLLEALQASIVALELLPAFLQELCRRARLRGVEERVLPLQADMAAPPLQSGSLDLVWSEGAIYAIGFDAGLAAWRPLLRQGGCLAVSELCWLEAAPSREARAFWKEEYPAMRSVEENARALETGGFEVLGRFELPERDWWREYYTPLEARCEAFAAKGGVAAEVAAMELREIELRRHHGAGFGYVFFLARARD